MIAARPLRTSYSPCKRPLGGLAGPWWPCSRRRHQWHQGARQVAWAGCAVEGCRPARVRRHGGMVGMSARTIPVRLDRAARRATIPRHRSLPAPVGARYQHSQWSRLVRDAGGVQRVRAGDDPRSRSGGTGSRTGHRASAWAGGGRRHSRSIASVLHWMKAVACVRQHGCSRSRPPRSARSGGCWRMRPADPQGVRITDSLLFR